ncbi:MAG: flagellar protein FliS [Candidatus Omnitrophica bacterium]|nr:flagellar protein FliS [Candidatus Omnitrophota bacterium]
MEENRKYTIENLKSMSDLEALILLYDKILEAGEAAQKAWEEKDLEAFHQKTDWMVKIIEGLIALVDMKIDPKLGGNLLHIYDYARRRIAVAQSEVRQTPHIIKECCDLLGKLRDAWIEVKEKGDITASFRAHLTSEDARFLNIEI